MAKLVVSKIKHLNTLVIRQINGGRYFLATDDSIVISVDTLAFILKFMITNGYLSPKVLETILQEANDANSV